MKIGVDASSWVNQRGPGRHTRELLRALLALDQQNVYLLFLDAGTAAQCKDLPVSERVIRVIVETSQVSAQGASASGHRSLRDLWAMGQAVRQYSHDLDLFYFPSVHTFFPLRSRAKVAVTIHDMIPEHYPELMFPHWHNQFLWRLKVRWAVWQANLITTVSQTAKRDIMRKYRLADEVVKVVPNAVNTVFRPLSDGHQTREVVARYGVGSNERFILYVGGLSPHKNLSTVIDAYASLIDKRDVRDVKLVLVGDFKKDVFYSNYPALREKIETLGLTGKAIFTGFLSDLELLHFYNAAELLVLASFDEGFGLPALEAMACGAPVVASRAGALPEVIGEAGQYFDPSAPKELRECLHGLLEHVHLRKELRLKGLRRSQEFSWELSAKAILAAFEQLAMSSANPNGIL